MPLKRELLEIIACPRCKGDLLYKEIECELLCNHCKLIYSIQDDIPILLQEEAKPFEESHTEV